MSAPTQDPDTIIPPEDWCDHHPEWADDAGRCHHPRCTVIGRQVWVYPFDASEVAND